MSNGVSFLNGVSGAPCPTLCMVLKNQTFVPNKGLNEIEIDGINYPMVTSKQNIKYTISNSFAFGGNNTSLIFGICNED